MTTTEKATTLGLHPVDEGECPGPCCDLCDRAAWWDPSVAGDHLLMWEDPAGYVVCSICVEEGTWEREAGPAKVVLPEGEEGGV